MHCSSLQWRAVCRNNGKVLGMAIGSFAGDGLEDVLKRGGCVHTTLRCFFDWFPLYRVGILSDIVPIFRAGGQDQPNGMDRDCYHSDEELFSRIKQGSEPAFTALYERHWEALYARASLLLDSTEDAEEVVHDLFVTLWKRRTALVIQKTFRSYVAAMLQYHCYKVLASRRRQRLRMKTLSTDRQQDDITREWLDFAYLQADLEAAVCALPEKCQQVYRLSREQGLSHKKIAEQLHISVNTVRTHMHRALEKLKTAIQFFFFF